MKKIDLFFWRDVIYSKNFIWIISFVFIIFSFQFYWKLWEASSDDFITVPSELENLLNIGSWGVGHVRQKQVQGYYKIVRESKIKNKMIFAIISCSAAFMETVCFQRLSQHSRIQSQQWKQKNNKWNLFRIYNKDTRVTLLTSF